MRGLREWFGGRRAARPAAAAVAPPVPDEPVAVIGDVHGCDGLLGRLLDRLAREAPAHRVVLVGDLIDRGDDSRAVVERLMARPDAVVLRGNHETMCLEFLAEPEARGRRWLRNGGLQTLASYGVGGLGASPSPDAVAAASDALARAMGGPVIEWLMARPLWWRSGTVAVVHAGADPREPVEAQPGETLVWGHERFGREPRGDGLWVAHGHTIVPEPLAAEGRIAVDTGAFATGRLTAALIDGDGVRFVTA